MLRALRVALQSKLFAPPGLVEVYQTNCLIALPPTAHTLPLKSDEIGLSVCGMKVELGIYVLWTRTA